MRSAVLTLYLKELKSARRESLYGPLAFAIILMITYYFAIRGSIPSFVPIAIAFTPLGLWPLIAIVQGVSSLKGEWSAKTVYLMSLLPVPGWKILGAKVGSVMTTFLVTNLLGVGLGLLMIKPLFGPVISEFLNNFPTHMVVTSVVITGLCYTLAILTLVVVSQLSYLASTLLDRFGWILFAVTFFVSFWVIGRLGEVLSLPFNWLPQLTMYTFNMQNGMATSADIKLNSGDLVGWVLSLIALFIAASHILERDSEV